VAPSGHAIATFVQDDENPGPLVDRGAPPLVVRQALAHSAAFQGHTYLPKVMTKRADGRIDWDALPAAMLPEWARGGKRGWSQPRPAKRNGVPKPISGSSDAPVQDGSCLQQVTLGAHCVVDATLTRTSRGGFPRASIRGINRTRGG
jgi:hypothetical protein